MCLEAPQSVSRASNKMCVEDAGITLSFFAVVLNTVLNNIRPQTGI